MINNQVETKRTTPWSFPWSDLASPYPFPRSVSSQTQATNCLVCEDTNHGVETKRTTPWSFPWSDLAYLYLHRPCDGI